MSIIDGLANVGRQLVSNNQLRYNSVTNTVENLMYRMYLQEGVSVPLQLPVNPETIKVSNPGGIDNYNIVNIGDIIRPKIPGLRTWTFNSVFLQNAFNPLNNTNLVWPPMYYVKTIQNWMKERKVLKFTINSVGLLISFISPSNYEVLIDKFDYEERGGEPGDIYYSLSLRQYRRYGISVLLDKLAPDDTSSFQPTDTSAVANQSGREVDSITGVGAKVRYSGEVGQLSMHNNGDSFLKWTGTQNLENCKLKEITKNTSDGLVYVLEDSNGNSYYIAENVYKKGATLIK